MSKIETLKRLIKEDKWGIVVAIYNNLFKTGIFNGLSDESYLKLSYLVKLRKKLDLEDPKTMNEKIQWLKLYNRKPEYTKMVDKILVKDYVADKIGEEYIIKTLGVWDKFEDIDFDKLPNKFVLKCNHDSGSIVICHDKSKFDKEKAKKVIQKGLRRKFFYYGREWVYKDIDKKILCEEYIGSSDRVPEDYKVLCINGKPDNMMICLDRDTGITKYYFMDLNWNLIRGNEWGKNAPKDFKIEKPKNFDKMIEFSKILSKDIPLVRVDFFDVDGKLYFGELTFYPDSGFDVDISKEMDLYLGEKINLKEI